jgi:hypothetical protein
MQLSDKILGTTITRQLQERHDTSILTIGSDRFTRADLAHVDCFNFVAAQNLSNAINDLGAPNIKYVFDRIAPSQLVLPRVGAIALAVLGAAFEARKVGNLEAWVSKHMENIVTFHRLKERELAEQAEERKAKKQRQRKRNAQAHELRVVRHTERHQSAAGR